MISVHDAASFIVNALPSTSQDWMKLQKLVYYSQVWSLVWDGAALFHEPVQAWKNGPVAPSLYRAQKHGGGPAGAAGVLSTESVETVNAVLSAYGKKPGAWLSALAHRERPWIEARQGLPPEARGVTEISHAAILDWYRQHPVKPKTFSDAYLRGLEILVETDENEIGLLTTDGAVPGEAYLTWLESGDTSWPD